MTDSDRAELEALADRLMRTPAARRALALVETSEKVLTEEAGRAMWENIPGRPGIHGEDDVRDENEALQDVFAEASLRDLGEVAGIELGCWAASDPVKRYAVDVVAGRASTSVRHFAAAQGVSESLVYRRIRQAKQLRCSLARSS